MGIALQLLFTGLGVGSVYALVALGFVLIYRATNVVNFAQGDFAMLGAFSMVVLCIDLQLPYWLGILITLAAMLVFGALFNFAVYYPLRNRGFQPVIISTIGASILLENGVLAAYGPRPQTLPGLFSFQGLENFTLTQAIAQRGTNMAAARQRTFHYAVGVDVVKDDAGNNWNGRGLRVKKDSAGNWLQGNGNTLIWKTDFLDHVSDFESIVWIHEFGHNLGLCHPSGR